eukprot:CAMPEP_0195278290 /NCGR_PEP_ID=MMETSP0706-20130129/19716_1 /TAXON_ID=33640 /ORGANISM="Asterionellopsis glacialis, Strain CCMP134" /LENGTH=35 /DNA_ID= /DNA_START= /DNA_END= /DNA_ORIENTATION=
MPAQHSEADDLTVPILEQLIHQHDIAERFRHFLAG